jgi:hypothetical protein
MTYVYPDWELGADTYFKIAASAKQGSPHHWKFSKMHAGPRFAHDFQLAYVYDYIAIAQATSEVIQNRENEHVRSMGQGETRH